MRQKFKTKDLLEAGLPYDGALHDEIDSHSRWSVHHKIVFEREGKFWRTTYSVGATEMQEEHPWEYQEEVECEEVVLKTVKVKEWVEA